MAANKSPPDPRARATQREVLDRSLDNAARIVRRHLHDTDPRISNAALALVRALNTRLEEIKNGDA